MEFARRGTGAQIVTLATEMVVAAQRDERLRAIINDSDLSLCDTIGLLTVARRRGADLHERVTGIGMTERLCAAAAVLAVTGESLPVYFLGGKEGVAADAAAVLEVCFPGCKLPGRATGISAMLKIPRSSRRFAPAAQSCFSSVWDRRGKKSGWRNIWAKPAAVPAWALAARSTCWADTSSARRDRFGASDWSGSTASLKSPAVGGANSRCRVSCGWSHWKARACARRSRRRTREGDDLGGRVIDPPLSADASQVLKPLVPVAGVPNAEHVIHYLRSYGFDEIAINLHYLADAIVERWATDRASACASSTCTNPSCSAVPAR